MMSKTLQKDISFSPKVQQECYRAQLSSQLSSLLQAKMNSYRNLPVYSLICIKTIKDEKIISNQ